MANFKLFNKAILASVLAVFVVSCDKEKDQSDLTVDLLKKATIEGYVYADLDLNQAGLESAPQGTKLILTVEYSQFNTNADGEWMDTVTVGANGSFTAQVPVTTDGVEVDITPLPYKYAQVQGYDAYHQTINKYYTASRTSVDLIESEIEVVEITYNANSFDNFVEMVELSGNLVAELDEEEAGLENCASGITLVFHGDAGWVKTVTTGADGAFTVVVPKNNTVYVDCEFTATKSVYNAISDDYDNVLYNYELDSKNLGSFGASVDECDLSAGNGTEVE